MSAFQVAPAHLVYLIGVMQALPRQPGADPFRCSGYLPAFPENAARIFEAMAEYNAVGVHACYEGRHGDVEPVPVPDGCRFPAVTVGTVGEIVAAIKAVDCYVYQSCDAPNWDTSVVARWMRELREALIRCLPGYEAAYRAAPWSIC